jgi:HSP20 family molecular chaperone IbpA
MTMEDIDISVSDGLLTIKGEKKAEKEVKEEDRYCSERVYGSFRRTLSVPRDLDESNIHATYDNGVLEVLLPKAEQKKITLDKPTTFREEGHKLTPKEIELLRVRMSLNLHFGWLKS